MLRPEPMPAQVVGNPVADTDVSWMGCFSYRIGLIALCWTLVVMSVFSFFTLIEYMIVAPTGGLKAALAIVFIMSLMDAASSGVLLLGIRDTVVRVRLNIWLVWNAVYSVILLILCVVDLSVIVRNAGVGVMTGFQTVIAIAFRLYCMWTGWKYREDIMSMPPPPTDVRQDRGVF